MMSAPTLQSNPIFPRPPYPAPADEQQEIFEMTLERYNAQDNLHRAIFDTCVKTGKARLIERDKEYNNE